MAMYKHDLLKNLTANMGIKISYSVTVHCKLFIPSELCQHSLQNHSLKSCKSFPPRPPLSFSVDLL